MNIEQMILKAIDNNEMIKFLRGEVILVGMFMILQNANSGRENEVFSSLEDMVEKMLNDALA